MADPCRVHPCPHGALPAPPGDLLDHLPAAFVLLDGAWRVTFANADAERLLDRPRAELLGRTVWDVVPELVGTRFETAFREAADGAGPVSFEAPLPSRTGTWLDVHAWPVPGALAVHVVDTSARRNAEEAARRASATSGSTTTHSGASRRSTAADG